MTERTPTDRGGDVGVLLAGAALLCGLVTVVPFPASVRAVIVVPFLLVCPGLAVVRLLGVGDPLAQVVLGVAASLGLEAAVAEMTLFAGAWSPVTVVRGFLALTIVATVPDVIQRASHHAEHPGAVPSSDAEPELIVAPAFEQLRGGRERVVSDPPTTAETQTTHEAGNRPAPPPPAGSMGGACDQLLDAARVVRRRSDTPRPGGRP